MTTETQAANTVANFDKFTDSKSFKFSFKKDKLGNKRNTIEVELPVPSVEGILQIVETGGKELELLREAIADLIRRQAASIISDDENLKASNFPLDKVRWTAIANMPKEDRRSNSIPAETWEAFAKDYIEVMPAVANKSLENVTNATIIYLKKFSLVKTNKEVISKLKDQLALYLEHSKNADEFTEILELLVDKADTYLKADDIQQLVANL